MSPMPLPFADAIQTTIAVIDNVLNHLSSAPGPSNISYARADAMFLRAACLRIHNQFSSKLDAAVGGWSRELGCR